MPNKSRSASSGRTSRVKLERESTPVIVDLPERNAGRKGIRASGRRLSPRVRTMRLRASADGTMRRDVIAKHGRLGLELFQTILHHVADGDHSDHAPVIAHDQM